MIGKTLSHYKVLEEIGEGGMGAVYMAEDLNLGRKVALKILREEMASNPDRLERFRREAQAVAALNHPNIVTIHSIEEAPEGHFITMELVQGKGLDEIVTGDGLSSERMLEIAQPLIRALVAAHERGITHRDLKPANIMVTDDGTVKILDFGLAKLHAAPDSDVHEDLPTQALTQVGTVVGTIPYMSPEQVQGKPVDHRTDIFSLGVVLYEMATGHRPFGGESSAGVASAILRDVPDADRRDSAGCARPLWADHLSLSRKGAGDAIPDGGRYPNSPVESGQDGRREGGEWQGFRRRSAFSRYESGERSGLLLRRSG